MLVLWVLEARRKKKGGGGVLFVVGLTASVLPKLSHTLNPHSLTSYPPLAALICKLAAALFANEGGIISQEHLVTTTIIHTSDPGWATLSLSFELLLAIWQGQPPTTPPSIAPPETLVGGGASTTTTVFGLLELHQGLGSQWSMEAKQSPRPRAPSTEHSLGWRPFWYAGRSEHRAKQRGSNVYTLRPELYTSWRKKETRRTRPRERPRLSVQVEVQWNSQWQKQSANARGVCRKEQKRRWRSSLEKAGEKTKWPMVKEKKKVSICFGNTTRNADWEK